VLTDRRGTVLVEYVALLALVSVACALATGVLIPPLVRLFFVQEAVLFIPIPF
jgi:hypothetical protein